MSTHGHSPNLTVGRYAIYDELAAGGMATVHLGRLRGAAGFSRIVAVKRMHARFAEDPELVAMFTDEARLASRFRHPNVVSTLDVLAARGELFLVMEYVHGDSLSRLIIAAKKQGRKLPPDIAASILVDSLHGLHEVHEAKDELGRPLGVVHRDFSPQNILVGADGSARVLDFGVAKTSAQGHVTGDVNIKGKIGYMPPEQLLGEELDRRTDVYAAGVVLWESLTSTRLFPGRSASDAIPRLLAGEVAAPSSLAEDVPPELDRVVLRALSRDPGKRQPTAADLARAIEAALPIASASRVGAWVKEVAEDALSLRSRLVARIEAGGEERHVPSSSSPPPHRPSGHTQTVRITFEAPLADESTEPDAAPPLVLDATPLLSTEPPPPDSSVPGGRARVASLSDLAATQPEAPAADSAPEEAPPPRRAPIAIVAAVLAVVALVVVLLVSLRREPTVTAPAPVAAGSAPSADAVTPPAGSSAPPPVMPEASAAPPTSTAVRDGGKTSSAKPTAPPRPKADCNPPFVLLDNGTKRYKKECFK